MQPNKHAHLEYVLVLHHTRCEAGLSHQTVSLERLHQGVVRVHVHQESLLNVLHEVQVFKGGLGLLALFLGRAALARGALQVELEVQANDARQDVIHHHDTDVLPSGLNAVQTEELGQQRAGVLVQVLRDKHRRASLKECFKCLKSLLHDQRKSWGDLIHGKNKKSHFLLPMDKKVFNCWRLHILPL